MVNFGGVSLPISFYLHICKGAGLCSLVLFILDHHKNVFDLPSVRIRVLRPHQASPNDPDRSTFFVFFLEGKVEGDGKGDEIQAALLLGWWKVYLGLRLIIHAWDLSSGQKGSWNMELLSISRAGWLKLQWTLRLKIHASFCRLAHFPLNTSFLLCIYWVWLPSLEQSPPG